MDADPREIRGRPAEILERRSRAINAGLADPKIIARLTDLGSSALTFSPTVLDKYVVDETEKWSKVIKAANIRPE